MQSEASSQLLPSAKSGRQVPPSQCALASQSASVVQPVLQVGGVCTGCPLQETLGKKPHELATTKVLQALSSSTPGCVPHWLVAPQVAALRVP
jgi:hypothetical protein